MSEEVGQARSREEAEVSAANGDQPVSVTQSQGLAFVALAREYLGGSRQPVSYRRSQELLRPIVTQPGKMLGTLERLGLISCGSSRGQDRNPIVFTDKRVHVKEGGNVTQVWPESVVRASPEPPEPVPTSILSREQTLAYLTERFVDTEFTVAQVVEGTGMKQGTVYDRIRPLVASGQLVQVGGTKGKGDPARYRVVAPSAAPPVVREDPSSDASVLSPSAHEDPAPVPTAPREIKSKDELVAELDAANAEIEEAEAAARSRRVERIRGAEAEVQDLTARLEAARGRLQEAERSLPVAEGIEPTVERRDRLRSLIKNYDLLIKGS